MALRQARIPGATRQRRSQRRAAPRDSDVVALSASSDIGWARRSPELWPPETAVRWLSMLAIIAASRSALTARTSPTASPGSSSAGRGQPLLPPDECRAHVRRQVGHRSYAFPGACTSTDSAASMFLMRSSARSGIGESIGMMASMSRWFPTCSWAGLRGPAQEHTDGAS